MRRDFAPAGGALALAQPQSTELANDADVPLSKNVWPSNGHAPPGQPVVAIQSFLPALTEKSLRAIGTPATAYAAPGSGDRLAGGLPVLAPELCASGDVAPPASAIPESLTPLIPTYVFRTTGRDTARPGCVGQGPFPRFGTTFPQLRSER